MLLVPVAGICVLGVALVDLILRPPNPTWIALATLTILTGSFTVKVPGLVARLSVSEPFVFAATLWFGPAVGAVTAALDALVMSLWLTPGIKTFHRVLFNLSVLVISIWVSSQLFFLLSGINPYAPHYGSLADFIAPLYIFTLCCFLLNSGLVAVALSYERGLSAIQVWRHQFLWLSLNYFGGASVAAVLVVYAKTIDLAVLGAIIPLLIISYLTFRTALGRLDDATEHLKELNTLYLSTVETLAMAIDAKDQITHGHIRRVQKQAVALAKSLGVNDERQLKAIEAAALLHDMGKLAIPEHILNKPGRLLPSEFDIMKQHAAIGADILAEVRFPYPVVPIVRHHHENWDGTGYPDGIKGTDIPIGARVLAVVDCFDALTSDRPYRPRLAAEEAMSILLERRGSMYDPLVIDTFIRDHSEISAIESDDAASRTLLDTFASHNLRIDTPSAAAPPPVVVASAIGAPLDILLSLTPTTAGLALSDLGVLLFRRLQQSVPFAGMAIFVVDPTGTALKCAFAEGKGATAVTRVTMSLGDRLTGWVGANRTAIWNSDAALDVGVQEATSEGVRLCSSIPLIAGEDLVGVLTLYGTHDQEISLGHRYLLESLAPVICSGVEAAIQRSASVCIDATRAETRNASLAVLDGALSHKRSNNATPFVRFVYVKPRSDARKTADITAAIAQLQAALVAQVATSTRILKTSDSSFLIVSQQSDVSQGELVLTIDSVIGALRKVLSVHNLDVQQVAINSPIELHEALRKLESQSTTSPTDSKALH